MASHGFLWAWWAGVHGFLTVVMSVIAEHRLQVLRLQ